MPVLIILRKHDGSTQRKPEITPIYVAHKFAVDIISFQSVLLNLISVLPSAQDSAPPAPYLILLL